MNDLTEVLRALNSFEKDLCKHKAINTSTGKLHMSQFRAPLNTAEINWTIFGMVFTYSLLLFLAMPYFGRATIFFLNIFSHVVIQSFIFIFNSSKQIMPLTCKFCHFFAIYLLLRLNLERSNYYLLLFLLVLL